MIGIKANENTNDQEDRNFEITQSVRREQNIKNEKTKKACEKCGI